MEDNTKEGSKKEGAHPGEARRKKTIVGSCLEASLVLLAPTSCSRSNPT